MLPVRTVVLPLSPSCSEITVTRYRVPGLRPVTRQVKPPWSGLQGVGRGGSPVIRLKLQEGPGVLKDTDTAPELQLMLEKFTEQRDT